MVSISNTSILKSLQFLSPLNFQNNLTQTSKITELQSRSSKLYEDVVALGELAELATTLKQKANVLRTIEEQAPVKKLDSSDENVISGSASGNATENSYTINVTALAETAALSFDDRYTSSDDYIYSGINNSAPVNDRTVQIDIGQGAEQESVQIELNSTTKLSDFVDQFNQQTTVAEASLVNLGSSSSPSYGILIASNETGITKGNLAVTVGSAVTDGGAGAFNSYTIDQAQDASLNISGISGNITRSTNYISDVIESVNLELNAVGTSVISVSYDSEQSAKQVSDLVSSFNEIVDFSQSPLNRINLDDSLLSSLRGAFSSSSAGQNISLLGISTSVSGQLEFDEEQFQTALANSPEEVEQALHTLGDQLSGPNGIIETFTRINGSIDHSTKITKEEISEIQNKITAVEDRLATESNKFHIQTVKFYELLNKLSNQQQQLASIKLDT